MDWLTSSGKIVYDPKRGDMKNNTKGWCVIEVDREITRYYRWWMARRRHIFLHQPAWDAHISVVRGERIHPRFADKWKQDHGKVITFQYEHGDIQVSKDKDQPGHFFWIRVMCPEVDQIREQLGLIASWKYHHITIGRTYY